MSAKRNRRVQKFSIRLSGEEAAMIRQAAALRCTTATNFIRQQALLAAEELVHDQGSFVVTDQQWTLIEQALSQPARILPGLRQMLARPDDWDC